MDNAEKMAIYIGYTRRRKTTQQHNAICVVHHYMQIACYPRYHMLQNEMV